VSKFNALEKIEGHKNYYVNPTSGKIYYRKRHQGQMVSIATGLTSIKAAKKFVEDRLIEIFSANPTAEKRQKRGITNPMISDLWAELMEEKSAASEKSTMDGYRSSWKYGIEPFWGQMTAQEISPISITKWENWYLKYHPERVFFNTHKHFLMLLRSLKKQRLIEDVYKIRDLDEIIAKKTKKKKVGRVYTDAEIKALLDNAVNDRTRLGILIYRYMGARKNEILKSMRVHWNLKKSIADIWSFKNQKWREVPIPDVVAEPLKIWLKSHDSEWLFPAVTNPQTHIKSQVFDKDWAKTKKAAGFPDWNVENAARIHDLRHTFATQTKTDGWHPLVACKVLDMSLEEYQSTYVHITTDEIQSLMRKSFGVKP
jgi:integrase